jgi:hypothetical protein
MSFRRGIVAPLVLVAGKAGGWSAMPATTRIRSPVTGHRSPVTGHGITDAFCDAELLANAVHAGLDGTPMADALEGYQVVRDQLSRDVFETTEEIAALEWSEDSLLEIFMRFGAASSSEAEQIAAFA